MCLADITLNRPSHYTNYVVRDEAPGCWGGVAPVGRWSDDVHGSHRPLLSGGGSESVGQEPDAGLEVGRRVAERGCDCSAVAGCGGVGDAPVDRVWVTGEV